MLSLLQQFMININIYDTIGESVITYNPFAFSPKLICVFIINFIDLKPGHSVYTMHFYIKNCSLILDLDMYIPY